MSLDELLNKVKLQERLNEDEIQLVLSFIKDTVIHNLDEKYGDHKVRCQESSIFIAELSYRFNFAYYGFDTGSLFMKELYHHFGFVGFNGTNHPNWYLIDLTFEQFNRKTYPVYIDSKSQNIISPGNYISKDNKERLLKDGYLKLTQENLNDYIDAFIKSYSTKKFIDKQLVYNKLFGDLDRFNIKFANQFTDSLLS